VGAKDDLLRFQVDRLQVRREILENRRRQLSQELIATALCLEPREFG
jgi:hypothetical protein